MNNKKAIFSTLILSLLLLTACGGGGGTPSDDGGDDGGSGDGDDGSGGGDGGSANSNWSTPALLETNDAGGVKEIKVSTDPNGNAIAVWVQKNGTGQFNVMASVYNASSGWGAAEALSANEQFLVSLQDPTVAMDDSGDAIAAWDGPGGSIVVNRYISGTGWSGAEIITDISGSRNPVLAVNGSGDALACWQRDDSFVTRLYTKGSGWGAEQIITIDGVNVVSGNAQAALDDSGNAIITWIEENAAERPTLWSNRYAIGSGWGGPQRLDTNNDNQVFGFATDLAGNKNGEAVAVWTEAVEAFKNQIWASRFSGGAWSAPERIYFSGNDDTATGPNVAIDGSGNAMAAWRVISNNGDSVESSRFTVGSGWGAATSITSAADDSGQEQLSLAINESGQAIAVWHQSDRISLSSWSEYLQANRYTPGTGWAGASAVSAARTSGGLDYIDRTDVAIDPSGNAISIWSQEAGADDTTSLYASRSTP